MNAVHDVTQRLGVDISKEDTGKVAVNFGEAGRQLGSLFARYQYENKQKEFSQGVPAIPSLNLNLSTPDLSNIQTAKDVEDMSFQYAQKLEEATRAKASGNISDAEFNKRVSDADNWAYSKGMNLAGMKKARDSVAGFNDVNKHTAVGTYLAIQEGKKKGITDVTEGDTERHLKLGQEITGRTDLPPEQLIQIGAQRERAENNLLNNPKVRAELEKLDISKEEIDKIDTVTVLDYFGPFIEEAAYRLRELDPVQRYNVMQRLVTDKAVSLGINLTPSQQETLTTRLSSYKNASKEDLESRKNMNDHMSENERRAKLNYYAALPPNIKESFYMAEMAGFKLAEFDPKMTEAILNYMKDGTKSPPMDAKTQENLYRMSLQNTEGSRQLPADWQNNINKVVNKETIKNNSQTDSKSIEANNKNASNILNHYAGVDTSKLTPEAKEESKQAIKSVVNQVALKVSQELDNRFSIGVSPLGMYIALYDGKPYKASATGEFFGTDGALLIQTVSKMNEAKAAYDNFQVSNKERLEAISDVVFSGKTTGEIAAAPLHLPNAALGGILDLNNWFYKMLGADPKVMDKLTSIAKRHINEGTEAFARGVDELTGSTGAQQHKMLEPEMTKITKQDINAAIRRVRGEPTEMTELRTNLENMTTQDVLAAIRRYKGETTEVFDESDRPTGELEDTGEPTPEIMTAALEVKGTKQKTSPATEIVTGGKLPQGAVKDSGRSAISLSAVEDDMEKTKGAVDKAAKAIREGTDTDIKVKVYHADGSIKRESIKVPSDLALIVDGESFAPSQRGNTIGFGVVVDNISEKWLKANKIQLKDTPDEGYTNKVTVDQALELTRGYLNSVVDPKLKELIGDKKLEDIDPIRVMLARDVLYAYGPYSVFFKGYQKVGLRKYVELLLDETATVKDIEKYLPLFPPFKARKGTKGKIGEFPAPYGEDRIGLIRNYLKHIKVKGKGKGGK